MFPPNKKTWQGGWMMDAGPQHIRIIFSGAFCETHKVYSKRLVVLASEQAQGHRIHKVNPRRFRRQCFAGFLIFSRLSWVIEKPGCFPLAKRDFKFFVSANVIIPQNSRL